MVVVWPVVICFLFINFAVEYEPQHKRSAQLVVHGAVVICFLFINFAVEYEPQHKLIVDTVSLSVSDAGH